MEQESESAGTDHHHQDLKHSLDTNNGENKFTSENKDADSKPEESNGGLQSPSSKDGVKSSSVCSTPNSPEPSCAICLGPLQNKSFTDSCFHTFCFNCLVSWSKVKAECPLCKQKFKSIVHNVRSFEDYDQYYISGRAPESSWQNSDARRFRYSTTLTAERVIERRQRILDDSRQMDYQMHRLTYAPHSVAHRNRTSSPSNTNTEMPVVSLFRQRIYNEGLWVRQSSGTKVRCTSPSFYRQNPACTHRLTQWLQRELQALLYDSRNRVGFVLDLILALIMRYDIRSPEFFVHIEPYLCDQTSHFVHEFFNYASSPYEFDQYDDHISYDRLETVNDTIVLSSPGSDVTPLPMNDTPVVISSNASTSGTSKSKTSKKKQKRVNKLYLKRNQENDLWNVAVSTSSHSETTFEPCAYSSYEVTSGPSATSNLNSVSTVHDDSTDVEIMVVKVIKPRNERTPEMIDLVTSSDDDIIASVQNVGENAEISNGLTLLLRASELAEDDGVPGPSTSKVSESFTGHKSKERKKSYGGHCSRSVTKRRHRKHLSKNKLRAYVSSSTSDIDDCERWSVSTPSSERTLSSPMTSTKPENSAAEYWHNDSTDISDSNWEDVDLQGRKHSKDSHKSKLRSVVASMDHCYTRSDSSYHSSHSKKHRIKHKKKKKHVKHKHHKHRSRSKEK